MTPANANGSSRQNSQAVRYCSSSGQANGIGVARVRPHAAYALQRPAMRPFGVTRQIALT
ncbi:MAG TPA: hypothetical protein VGC15_13575 [Acetobacteraceae bacterium]